MRFFRSKLGVVTLLLAIALALFLIRPGVQQLRSRIVASTSTALGRQVEVGSVHLRMLPQPGFDLGNFVVHDDPAFGMEPMLRAQEVTAAIRLTSLLRGRLEIARLDLTEPSLNLVRDSGGRWNLEDLLERASRTSVAPTGKSTTELRPGFPYIEADRGRINFKFGAEKKPYALTDADFSLWQDSENQWGMRLEAQPVRTDFNLGDTGILRLNGSWQRAASLRETPLNFSLEWDRAQLGQVSQLLHGADQGWRGGLKLTASLYGSPADLNFQTSAAIEDFRRYDILGGGNLRLTAHCAGHYSTIGHAFSKLACAAPVGNGAIRMGGEIAGIGGPSSYRLHFTAQEVPMAALAALARHSKKDIPDDLVAGGTLSANFGIHRDAGDLAASWDGSGETQGFRLSSELAKAQLSLGKIPFLVSHNGLLPHAARKVRPSFPGPQLAIGPFDLPLGRPSPAIAQAAISLSGYRFSLEGDGDVQGVIHLARIAGLPILQPTANGLAKLDIQIAGSWAGLAPPMANGTLQLRSVRAEVPGVNVPVEISAATALLSPDGVAVRNLSAALGGTNWSGSLSMPRHCTISAHCLVQFDLHADQIATAELGHMLRPNSRKRPWYRWLSPGAQPGPALLSSLHATGKLTANRVLIQRLIATKAAAKVEVQNGKMLIADLRAEVLGGKQMGEWQADFSVKPPQYSGSGTLENVALRQLSNLMNDAWVTGTANAKYRVTASGYTAAELVSTASASLQCEARDGSLPHIVLPNTSAGLAMHRFSGRLVLHEGKFEIQEGKLEVPGGIYQISGTASLGRRLDLQLLRDAAHGFTVTGTLTEPRVVPSTAPETRAALKP